MPKAAEALWLMKCIRLPKLAARDDRAGCGVEKRSVDDRDGL
jgi:hypothetical protein